MTPARKEQKRLRRVANRKGLKDGGYLTRSVSLTPKGLRAAVLAAAPPEWLVPLERGPTPIVWRGLP